MYTYNREWGISGFTLKLVAMICMLTDHTAGTILKRILVTASASNYPFVSAHWQQFNNFYTVLRGVGRLAFPIYAFLIVEGFLHTRSVAKYAARLFVFALLSEVPFDLALNKSVWDIRYNNVYFTLFLGLLVIWGMQSVDNRIGCTGDDGSLAYGKLLVRSILDMTILFAGMALAQYVLRSDYRAGGILVIALMYLLRRQPETAMLASVVLLARILSEQELAALADVPLVMLYNGKRGRQSKLFFYAFYPVHLLVLSVICMAMGLGI